MARNYIIGFCLALLATGAIAAQRNPDRCNVPAYTTAWQYNVYTTLVTTSPASVLHDITIVPCFVDKATCDASRLQLNPPAAGVITWTVPIGNPIVINQNATRVVGPCYQAGD